MPLLLRTLLRPSSSSTSPTLNRLLLLPPSCRTSTRSLPLNHSHTQLFHASPPRKSLFLSTLHLSHDALLSLHTTTGLPWSTTIPLFAILLRISLMLPIAIYNRRSNIKQISLVPLIESWKPHLRHETMREVGHLGPGQAQKTFLKKIYSKRVELFRRYGCERWKSYFALVQIPVFLSVMETLRKMCGSNQGILGMIMGGDEVVEAGIQNTGTFVTADGLLDTAVGIPVEASLATEGALWFPNLLLADPHLALPFILSATVLLNILGGARKTYADMGIWTKRLTRSFSLLAICLGPMMLNVPSALLIYWISSSGAAYLQGVLLEKFIPIPKPVLPCVPKRQWKSGFGQQKPEGYVNPLLAMEKAAKKELEAKKAAARQKLALDQNQPIGKSGPLKGR
ncbi:hypothetical protein ONS95_012721 [Cadophora gregata]|uniref:uncharacterized protein n=1 Tax=Cadophora gregata TaxID=51156 RepID=UPI0026DC2187|nr:uncharacterized protein ONS95_012721 [Cadophora gregata]KAK0118435.1 hypothetical protein ONS95_012721 [Cadophora gregata]KAK0123502.1 hypothetical protein ONS96_010485 [Cadophora gregata f. sp. sojae]